MPDYLDIPGRPETFPPPPSYDQIAPLMPFPPLDGVYESIVGAPETWPPGTFEDDPNRAGPSLTALVPASAVLGDPDFTLSVQGNNFSPGATIVFAAQDEPTTFVSYSELTTGVDMSVWLGADVLQVTVRGANGEHSNALPFTFMVA